jgi:hypothetical protein
MAVRRWPLAVGRWPLAVRSSQFAVRSSPSAVRPGPSAHAGQPLVLPAPAPYLAAYAALVYRFLAVPPALACHGSAPVLAAMSAP